MARQHLQNGENMSFWKKCPLLAAVIVSGLVIEGAGVANGVKSGELEAACVSDCFYRFKTGRLSVE